MLLRRRAWQAVRKLEFKHTQYSEDVALGQLVRLFVGRATL